MVQVVLQTKERRKQRAARELETVRRYNKDGAVIEIVTLDANSPHFDQSLDLAFTRNVRRARRQNKQVIGNSAGVTSDR